MPRQVLQGTTYMISRRCVEQRFYLQPSAWLNAVILFLLAVLAEMFGMEVHGFTFMSNHYHLMMTDPHGKIPQFMARFNRHLALAVKFYHRIGGCIFDPCVSYHAMPLLTPEAVLDKLSYMTLNPVSAGLVPKPEQWEGLNTSPEQLGTVLLEGLKVPSFFKRVSWVIPKRFVLTMPPALRDQDRDTVVITLQRLNEDRRRKVRGPFRGMQQVHNIPVTFQPETQAPNKPQRIPTHSAKSTAVYRQARASLRAFRNAYRNALRHFRNGHFNTPFPEGTWWMIHYGGASLAT